MSKTTPHVLFSLSEEETLGRQGDRILNPPYPAAGESDGIYELVEAGLGLN